MWSERRHRQVRVGVAGITQIVIDLDSGADSLVTFFTLGPSAPLDVDGGSGIDTITGGDSADRIDGGTGSDVITGGSGPSTIRGDDGNDRVTGGNSGDNVSGGPGTDTLTGGGGNDRLDGDEGDDDRRVAAARRTYDSTAATATTP